LTGKKNKRKDIFFMANLELMNYKPQREPVSEQELIAYRSLCTGIFRQAVVDATDKRGTVINFMSAYTWLFIDGYGFLTDILGMELDQSRYNQFLNQLKSGDYEISKSIFSKKEVTL